MSGIILIFVVGLLNFGLGYALAVQLGYRPGQPPVVRQPALPDPEPEPPDEPPDPSAETPLRDLIQELISGGDEPSEWDDDSDWEDTFDPGATAEPDEPESSPAPDGPSAAGRLSAICREVDGHLAWLIDLDTRLRQTAGEHELFTLLAWIEELKEGCRLPLGEASDAGPMTAGWLGESPELGEAGRRMASAAAEQSARREAALAHLENVDLKGDLAAAAAGILEEIDRLQGAAHVLRECGEEALLAAVRLPQEGRSEAVDESLRIDPLTQFPSRIGLEIVLQEWWEAGGRDARPLSAALWDLDNFAEVNERFGLQAADGIVRASAERIGELAGENEVLVRYGGKRLLLLMFDAGAAETAERAEQVRQAIANTRFVRGEEEIRITLSGGVAAALPKEPPQHLLDRLEAAVASAKRAGRNCSFLADAHEAELIEPTELSIEPREVFV